MNKPTNYEQTQVSGDFTPVDLGGHYGIIKNVSERETKNGDPMIVVSIDFDKKDSQPDYFADAYKNDNRADKKWPNQATNYITSEYQGACTKGFKSFIKAYADSNGLDVESGIKWGDDFCSQFKNKKIGVVFGNVEELYNGEQKMRRKIRWFCDYNKVSEQRIPDDRYLPNNAASSNDNSFVDVKGTTTEEEIPFD